VTHNVTKKARKKDKGSKESKCPKGGGGCSRELPAHLGGGENKKRGKGGKMKFPVVTSKKNSREKEKTKLIGGERDYPKGENFIPLENGSILGHSTGEKKKAPKNGPPQRRNTQKKKQKERKGPRES